MSAMTFTGSLRVRVDLDRIGRNVEAIARRTGVPVLAVIKADAYGLGAARVAKAIADVVDGFCVFSLSEAVAIDLFALTGKPAISIGPPVSNDPTDYLAAHVRPAVSSVEQATALRHADPIL